MYSTLNKLKRKFVKLIIGTYATRNVVCVTNIICEVGLNSECLSLYLKTATKLCNLKPEPFLITNFELELWHFELELWYWLQNSSVN